MASVDVVLSCGTQDKKLKIPKACTFKSFRKKVQDEFPHLPKTFSIADSDFTEVTSDSFREILDGRVETWFLVRANRTEEFTLKKPRYELLRYDVHPNALTQSGNYHFVSSYQAFCEFIDNSIQATNNNHERDLERNIKLQIHSKDRVAVVFDNGQGMFYEGLKAFATYFLSQADRGLEPDQVDQTPAFLDGMISKFGVGATQAGFYLGDRIKVVTKRVECPYVTEITISKEKLHQRADEGKPVFEDYRCIRNTGDTSTLELDEEQRCLKELVESEKKFSQFTYVVITGIKDSHMEYMKADGGRHLTRSLAHVYHFYLWGETGCSGNMRLPSSSRLMVDVGDTCFRKVDIEVLFGDGRNTRSVALRDITDDLESRYQNNAKEWFPFKLTLKVPGLEMPQIVQGVVMYYPHESGQETNPRELDEDGESEPIFECFWQGRLAPLSYVHRLEFCSPPMQRTKKQRDVLPDMCYRRLKGILFFNRHTPISNNKLKILLDERKDLSSALEDATADRRLPKEFNAWLESCHKHLDKEVVFEGLVPGQPGSDVDGETYYKTIRLTTCDAEGNSREQRYTQGDIVKLNTKPLIYGRVLYFTQAARKHDYDKVVVIRQPEEVYHDQQEEKPISRIVDIPDSNTLKKVFSSEKQMLPKSVRVCKDTQGNDVLSKMTWIAGENHRDYAGTWVKVFSGERPPRPIVAVHNKKISIKQIVEGPEIHAPIQNDVAIEGERFGFKPFWLGKAGHYVLRYVAVMNEQELCSAKVDIEVQANVATFVRLDEPGERETPVIALGEPELMFKLHFRDEWDNPTARFVSGDNVKLEISTSNLSIKGTKDCYKPNRNGDLEVKGLILEPKKGTKGPVNREHAIRVNAIDVGDVIFQVRLKEGSPQSLKLPEFDTLEVKNLEEFPEFTVQLLDSWGQNCGLVEKKHRLRADSEAFAPGLHICGVDQGFGTFQPIKILVSSGRAPCSVKVKISLVTVETVRRKQVIGEVLKELSQFTVKVLPSGLPHRIKILHGDEAKKGMRNGTANGRNGLRDHSGDTGRECLELSAPAGSMLTGLRLCAFDESGRQLSEEELRETGPQVSTSWSGEVPVKNLPDLPSCPVAQLVQSTFVGNVTCLCRDVTCQSQIRIHPVEGEACKWSIHADTNTVEIECGAKKELATSSLRVRTLDKYNNPTECPRDLTPIVSLHSSRQSESSSVEFSGELSYKSSTKEFIFSNDAVLTGKPGYVTMTVCDKDSTLTKDSIRINLKPGPPHHIELWSQAFESEEQQQEQALRVFSGCTVQSQIHAYVCDQAGNKTPLKTSLSLSWQPGSAGQTVTKKTRDSGEAIFVSNALRCSGKPDHEVKIKIHSSDHRQLQAAFVRVNVEKSNRVTAVLVSVEDDGCIAGNNYPTLKITCQTEDNVPVDARDHLSLEVRKPDGNVINGSTVYRKPTQNNEGVVSFLPHGGRYVEQAGQWSVCCLFTEYRSRLEAMLPSSEHLVRSAEVKFKVFPGPAKELSVSLPSEESALLSASSTADLRGRTILPRPGRGETVELLILDTFGNTADASTMVDVTIAWPSGPTPPDVLLPALETSPLRIRIDNGKARLPRLSLKPRVGNYIGDYHLVFTAQGLSSCVLKFSFSTDEHIQRIQTEMAPLKQTLRECETTLREARDKCNARRGAVRSKLEPVRALFRGEPSTQDVSKQLQSVMGQLAQMAVAQNSVRLPSIPHGHPPTRIRQYIKGIVAELAYVSDPDLSRLLSWYLQHKMGVALTSTIQQQRKVYDANCAAYCEDTLLPFNKKNFDGSDGRVLPLEFPQPPANFSSSIQFAINLLEFSSSNGYLRSTLFWSLLSKTMVIDDLRSGQVYREHLVRMRFPCPTILTRDGHVIASDGLMDPKKRCPQRLDNLKFTFGALPPAEQPHFRELNETQRYLQDLSEALQEFDNDVEVVKQAEDRQKRTRASLTPQITALEKQLSKLRSPPTNTNEPPEKRKRK
ncbi:structural maintenance of chromosomes flexible hinge domain-containing protein 1-like isoform X1 [Nematostella vectensis]|uniref:structural maintenance of chromosomes flexible hinge domain-containing protein 1-like isoform X1 n=2 Tax=Nematostella vectensis TaxID=45351 RepID=UPI002076DC08|nr:structural maintenance of chromosomes flexible hinge domain-containing protein 1-like isoform X1 [Nematostella vectensis]